MSKRAIDKDNWNKALCENGFKKSTIWIVHLSQFLINCLAEYKSASFGAVVASWAVLHRCVDGIHINDIAEPKDFPENQDLIPHFYGRRAFREPEHILTGLSASCCVVLLSDVESFLWEPWQTQTLDCFCFITHDRLSRCPTLEPAVLWYRAR